MALPTTVSKVAQRFSPVKSNSPLGVRAPTDSMIHHNDHTPIFRIIYKSRGGSSPPPYGVSSSQRVITPGLFLNKFDYIRNCLDHVLGLTTGQREVTLRLLRFWAYYGHVYPKESSITNDPGCSKATFWRTIRILRDLGLIRVVNRYVIRPHAQISNLYRFDKLLLVIARYLAEHGHAFREKWLEPYLTLPGRVFWGRLASCQESRAGPYGSGEPLCLTS